MLSWLAMFVGKNLGMDNRIERYPEIKKIRFNEAFDKKLAQDLDRADDDGFAMAKNNFGAQPTDQDSDCWSDLWQRIRSMWLSK
ncbi:MAG: hypothetical protein Q7S13_01395 [Candidatus Omnitrophota bacterium]|nr:hypothetical protein [Candidatus Omnitrophota bacterium]